MRRIISLALIASLSAMALAPAAAAGVAGPPPPAGTPTPGATAEVQATAAHASEADAYLRCRSMGQSDGDKVSTGGAFATGLASGLLLGLIGTGIAFAVQGEPEPSAASLLSLEDNTCRMAYVDAYKSKGKSQKRAAGLGGGLLGTGVIVAVILVTSGN